MIRDLTAKEEEFLVKYCMEPENIWLALAIGQIQPVLRKKIVCFLEELDTNVRKKLKEYDLRWETCIQKTNLEEEESSIYKISMKAKDIQIELCYQKENLYVGIPKKKALPPADDLRDLFKDEGLKDSEEDDDCLWPWWIYPEESHKSVVDLITRHDDQRRREKIEYFTNELVLIAKAISKALRA